jgi:hypothetical protein
VLLLRVVAPVAVRPARLHLLLRPRVVVVLRELLDQRVELVRQLDAEKMLKNFNRYFTRIKIWLPDGNAQWTLCDKVRIDTNFVVPTTMSNLMGKYGILYCHTHDN